MKGKLGTVCMVLGAVLVMAALSLFLWNQYEDSRAGASVEEILSQMEQQIGAEEGAGVVEIDGNSYIGYLTIPALGLELPVMSDWSYENLRTAPCRYYGSAQTDDLVVAAHNYSRHFGNLKNLSLGDLVYFTDADGTTIAYKVVEVDTLNPTAVEEMTSSGYDLTLFTCTYSGQSRVTVRCDRIE